MHLLRALTLTIIAICVSLPIAFAHDGRDARPTYLGFRYYVEGPLYERLKKEFRPEWEQEEEMLRNEFPVYGIHETDLNGDSIPELIIRFPETYTTCNKNGCHNAVISIDDDEIKRLAYFQYAEVNIANTQTGNVKDLWVYDDPLNDYAASLYKWSGAQKKYIKFDKVDEE